MKISKKTLNVIEVMEKDVKKSLLLIKTGKDIPFECAGALYSRQYALKQLKAVLTGKKTLKQVLSNQK